MKGSIPRAFIDELINRLDIVELIDSYVPLRKMGRNFVACCPFHQEKTPSFSVSQSKQFYHCFGCGVSGNAIGFIMAYRNLPFPEAVSELASRIGMTIPQEEVQKKLSYQQDFYSLLGRVAQFYQHTLRQSEAARQYLSQRGLSAEIIEKFALGYAPEGWNHLSRAFPQSEKALLATGMLIENDQGKRYDRYRHRIMFPIYDRRGRIVGFGGRVLNNQELPKYLNSPETALFHKSKELYGLYQAVQNNSRPEYLLVVEGYMDVIALAQHGITQAVAALGTALSRDHIQSLLRYTSTLVFCFDGDNAGRKAAWKALESALPYLNDKAQFQFLLLPDNHDPDSLIREKGKEAFSVCVKEAISLDSFFFSELTEGLDLAEMADCSRLVDKAKPHLAMIPSGAYRAFMLQKLARMVRMEPDRIETVIQNKTALSPVPSRAAGSIPIQRTNSRIALALLIQTPGLVDALGNLPESDSLDDRGGKVLYELMTLLKQEPSIRTTGSLLEHFRDHEYYSWMSKLAVFSHQVPEAGIKSEFLGALKKMQQQNADKKIRRMLQRMSAGQISEEERGVLLKMIKEKNANFQVKN